jgi:outer membrane receptor protein involved in Fe transport
MRKSYRYLAIWLVACVYSITSFSQTVSISGNVRDNTSKESIPAVTVLVKGSDLGTFTDENGNFKIAVQKLPVTLVFSSIGFETQEANVSSTGQPVQVDLVGSTALGEEVVLAANRVPQRMLESPVTIERMSGATLRSIAAPNYYEALTNLKGVDMHTASLTFRTITTRGFLSSGNTRLNQLIDGMDNQAPGLNFSVGNIIGLTELDVDNIELLSGASSALYGSGGMNGTLLITSKNPFKYQGLSFNIKQGIMHVDSKQRPISPYYDWSMRYAKAFNDKFAFKISAQLVKANDWQADDYRNKQQIGVLSTVVGGNRLTDPNFNGINMYGDETSANMNSFSQIVIAQTNAAIPGLVGNANTYFTAIGNPAYPTNAQIAGFVSLYPAPAQPAVKNFLPFYIGLRNNYFQNYSVSRTGYEEKYLVDYNTLNFKFTGGLNYKITPRIEASWNTYFGTGTTVYTGADRYSLRNLKIAQHKLEIKHKNWFLRGYTTQENAGESYNASALGGYLNESWKPSTTWFPQYIGTFSEIKRQGGAAVNDYNAHLAARAAADVGRLLPGTPQFDAAVKTIRNTPIVKGGALFLDRTDLWAAEGQLNLSEITHFSEKLEVLVGAGVKEFVLNSQGTIFADTAGPIKIYEPGGYVQLKKSFINNILTVTASGRFDKQTNFKGQFTPRLTAVIRVSKNNNLRLSYQTAYRFPTAQDQYISLITGAGTLIGLLPEFQSYYKLNSTSPGYTPESILAYRAGGNPANTSILVKGTYKEVVPETVKSFEVGYKGVVAKKLLLDLYGYFSQYDNFLARLGFGQSKTGDPTGVFSPFTTTNISYIQNTETKVKSIGWGFGADYQLPRGFNLYGNIYSDELRNVPSGFVTYFNAPKYRWNLGLRNENVYRNIGFNIVVKWQDESFYEGTFVTGTLPAFATVDAQITYRMAKTKSVFRVGGTNIGNFYYRTGFGNPSVGGLYYVSYGYNIF